MARLGETKIKHSDVGADVTPGKEVIIEPPPPIPYENIDAVQAVVGPTEPKRCQFIPYLMASANVKDAAAGLVVDLKQMTVFPDIRLITFMSGADMVGEVKAKPGAKRASVPELNIASKSHKLQMFCNFPVHAVIGYPSEMKEFQDREEDMRPSDVDIFRRADHAAVLRKYQRKLLLAENMLQLNLNQVGHNGFSLRWDLDLGISDRLFAHVRGEVSDIERNRRIEAERMSSKVDKIEESFKKDLEALRKGCAYYRQLVKSGVEPQAAINRMRANRAASVSDECPDGDPTVESPEKGKKVIKQAE